MIERIPRQDSTAPFTASEQSLYTFDSCPNCGAHTFLRRLRVYKCAACYRFYCTACRSSWTHACPHCHARGAGAWVGRA